ncbi:hypothetical protein A2U04_05335 [Fusobacterium necrophorum subsp. funduliforme]|uniref:hypothetical protein n=1 Tax=Fusobacterium necrophorum TaxID=859 RepID=UPI000789345B|nr:hypothetical protein [Fusobacterium necrophorum]KYM48150.1 hypothetical protein A2U04_05335 [Fusobacterium necrophorum subsp. funduliforme]
MQLSTLQYRNYIGRVRNLSQNKDITDWVSECNIALPNTQIISSMEARFTLEEKLINEGNEVEITVFDDVGNTLYTLQGQASIPVRIKDYTGLETWEYSIKDSYGKLFEKVVAESITFYDMYLCNTKDKQNSLLYQIATNLGFREDQMDFEDVVYENGKHIRVPFVYFEEKSRWVDKLQAFIEATDGILYVNNKKLYFRPRNLTINNAFSFNRTNIITRVEERQREVLQNGIRVVYDKFEKLDNQVVFNLQKKIITEPNTKQDTEVPTMRIKFTTSAVNNPTLTKATGYYFTTEDPSSKVDVELAKGQHYEIVSWKETGAEVKFYNPYSHKLYVDCFEIKGIPLAMYPDNEVQVMFPNIREKHQENFTTINKITLLQTEEQAKFVAKRLMQKTIVNKKEYNFSTPFLHQIQLGGRYAFDLEDIHTVIEVTNIQISLKTMDFRMQIQGIAVEEEIGSIRMVSKMSGNSKEQFIDLSSIKDEIKDNKKEVMETVDKELEKITGQMKDLTQGIQDSKVKIYTLKPPIDTLTDKNIGDMYISNNSMEILVKEGNKLVWKPMKDEDTKKQLESYMQSTNSKLVTISYQDKAPQKPNVGDIWIDTKNDGIWKRWNGSEWEQVDSIVREALKKANRDIEKIETGISNINNTINTKIMAKAFVQEYEPQSGMKNHDIWYNPKSNTYKVWLNYRWNPASEDDIFPALRHYASLENAKLEMGRKIEKANERAGLFLTNNDEKFGAKNGTLAEVSLDKQGAIRLSNANNLLEWNVKDPWNPRKMKSKFYMGVTDVTKVPDDVYFKVGDESNGFSIELKEGSSKASVDGKDLSKKISDVDKNINNLAQADRENKRDLESRIQSAERNANQKAQESKEAAQRYADALVEAEQIRADKNATTEAKKQAEEKLNLAKNYAEEKAREAKSAAQKYADGKLQQFTQSIQTDIESIKSQLDGVIETWFYDDEPTLYNKPASDWTTTSEKEKHVGDLYYSKNGKSYRFMKDGNGYYSTYKWTEIADTDVAKALEEARKAKDTADKKRRVFVETPRPPYDEGDLWVKNDKVQVCRQTKEKGQFSVYDWRALSYTDDTKANEVEGKVNQNKEELDRNINNLAQADSENKRDLEEKLNTAKKEINAQLVNADGKWTALQGQYQETVRDVTNFKEQATGRLDSYETALQNGDFVITGRTVFDGNVNIVSKGTNERLEINSGNLSIYRTINGVEKKVTRIGNIRYGSISTDSKGKGVVHFTDMKEPLLVMPTIKAVNFGGNMASAFCYAEYVSACVYKFFIGGTRETYETPKNIKTVGTVVSYSNIYQYTIEGFGFTFPHTDFYPRNADISDSTNSYSDGVNPKYFNSSEYVDKLFEFVYGHKYSYSNEDTWEMDKRRYNIGITYIKPTFTIELKEYVNGEFNMTIFSKQVTLNFHPYKHYYYMEKQDFTHALNIRRNFTNRTNVRVELVVTFTEPRMGINGTDFYKRGRRVGAGSDSYIEYYYHVSIYHEFELKRFSQASFEGYNITSSYTSSKIEDSLGEGEVSYIAMEID